MSGLGRRTLSVQILGTGLKVLRLYLLGLVVAKLGLLRLLVFFIQLSVYRFYVRAQDRRVLDVLVGIENLIERLLLFLL